MKEDQAKTELPRHYREKSWNDPRVVVKDSKIQGKGLVATERINPGEVVQIVGGSRFTVQEIREGKFRPRTALKVDENLYLALPKDSTEESIDEFTNHSCDPSCWLTDEVTLVARREIKPGEEITMDYGTSDDEEGDVWIEDCKCGSPLCRHRITGDDWKNKEIQERYKGHFSPFIEKKISEI